MKPITRRKFLQGTVTVAAGCLLGPVAGARENAGPSGNQELGPGHAFERPQRTVPADFLGLSFETERIADDDYLVPESEALIRLIRGLGESGVIRIGGNSSDRPLSVSPRSIGRRQMARLADFLQATGWGLIYGLNLGSGTPEQAAAEAKLVTELCGDQLIAFQLGNEPDLFPGAGYRPRGYGVGAYLADWHRFAAAIKKEVPEAPFAGPDVSSDTSWLGRFGQSARADLRFLTHHYYSEGPAGNPGVTVARMLNSTPALLNRLHAAEKEAGPTGLPLRMTEINSVYGGGQTGISDGFAAVLWGLDALFTIAASGWLGVNFHSNQTAVYSPVLRGLDGHFHAQPVYYALRFFAQFGMGKISSVPMNPLPATFRAFAVRGNGGERRLVLLNLSDQLPVEVALGELAGHVRVHELTADRLRASNFRLNGTAVTESQAAFRTPGIPLRSDTPTRSVTVKPVSAQAIQLP